MLRRVLTVSVAVAMIGMAFAAGDAVAEPAVECSKSDPRTGTCLLWVSTPGSVDSAGRGSTDAARSVTETGVGNSEGDAVPSPCTYSVANPEPPLSHPVWAGRTDVDGTVYLEVCPRPDGYGSGYRTELVFVTSGTDPPAGPPIDPRVLAEQAISAMELSGPQIRMAPPPGSNSGLVGLPVWMWTERAVDTVGPVEQSASAGGVTVVAVAQVSRIVWDMGDGTTVVCGSGTPYSPGMEGESPDCGHVYNRASSRHVPDRAGWPITATSIWTITWTGGGLSGTETLELSSSTEVFVGELHVLNQDGGRP